VWSSYEKWVHGPPASAYAGTTHSGMKQQQQWLQKPWECVEAHIRKAKRLGGVVNPKCLSRSSPKSGRSRHEERRTENRNQHLQVHPVGGIEIRVPCQPFRRKSHPAYGEPRVSLILEYTRATDLNRLRAGPTVRLTTGQPLPRIGYPKHRYSCCWAL
jgi:hypothetical protein